MCGEPDTLEAGRLRRALGDLPRPRVRVGYADEATPGLRRDGGTPHLRLPDPRRPRPRRSRRLLVWQGRRLPPRPPAGRGQPPPGRRGRRRPARPRDVRPRGRAVPLGSGLPSTRELGAASSALRGELAATSLADVAERSRAIEAGTYPVPADAHRRAALTVTVADSVQVEARGPGGGGEAASGWGVARFSRRGGLGRG